LEKETYEQGEQALGKGKLRAKGNGTFRNGWGQEKKRYRGRMGAKAGQRVQEKEVSKAL